MTSGEAIMQTAEPAPNGFAELSESGKGTIVLDRVIKRYGDERVVDGVTLTIRPGEFFSLLGPSGSGKTTTLMMIAGFVDIDEGSISVGGMDISAVPPQRRGFGMVFQNYAIFPHLNVFENVAFPLRARRFGESEIRARVAWALDLVRLDRFADRYAPQLSGGQQQRVAIARAIVFHPSVVLMDEPLGALDKNLRYEMQVEIQEIQRRLGMTVVYVTHDQEEAMNMSDRIAIMNRGRIDQVGPPTEIYERPANVFSGRFLGEANLIEGGIERVEAGVAYFRGQGALKLRARNAGNIAANATASFFVRPERIRIAAASDDAGAATLNSVTGKVRRASFLGNVVRYAVEVAPAILMTVDVQNVGGRRMDPGEMAVLTWPIDDSILLTN
jgi:putative spermidine/putrescine transport system ATP-binding protein